MPTALELGTVSDTVGGVGSGMISSAASSGSSQQPYTDWIERIPFVTLTPEIVRT